jgi:2-keto-4-pentenoate hydratase/2-oxohepta-3-ene-1,7-dioic acid hydratase in catechol pathway
MKYCRFKYKDVARWGVVESVGGVERITHVLTAAPEHRGAVKLLPAEAIDPIAFAEAPLLAAVEPSKIICVGKNYRAHAAEMDSEVPKEPLLFFKPPSALLKPGGEIRRPTISERVDYEGELGVVIGKRCYKLPVGEDVRPYIRGYTAVNDVTARDLQKKDNQWARAKGFDTFCPVGPLVTDEIDPWKGVAIETKLNGKVWQQGSTTDLVFSLDALLRYISNIFTLLPGDLICTGTPEGVSPMVAGDVVEVSVEGVGTLRNAVVDDRPTE